MLSDAAVYERFMAKVVFEPSCGCWIFVGAGCPGYGLFSIGGRQYPAHHVSYVHFKGPIPGGLEPDHTCRLKCCVNPDHVEAVTHRENLRRARPFRSATNQSRNAVRTPTLLHVIDMFGSLTALAEAVGMSVQAVSGWTRIPERRVPVISELTGIDVFVLRPDIFGPNDLASLPKQLVAPV